MHKEFKVTFEPSGRTVYVLPGTILLEAADRAGFVIETPCGGMGTCGKCLVRVTDGDCPVCAHSRKVLSDDQLAGGMRLACQCKVETDLTVEVPESSLFQVGHQILQSDTGETVVLNPDVKKRFLNLVPPSREDGRSDVERLEAASDCAVDLAVVRDLPSILREQDFSVTATVLRDRIVRVEAGDKTDCLYGMAFDVGTTTLVGTLIDLVTGADMVVVSCMNPQTSFGDDVVSRIKKCRDEADGLSQLQGCIVEAVNALIADAASQTGIRTDDIMSVALSGNTAMQQILCGIDPKALGEIPFVPVFRETLKSTCSRVGLTAHACGEVMVFPQIGGFVGGDTVAGILATGMDRVEAPVLLVDVGTNGEIVLAHDGRLIATSVAAGPAFEGARIINGMRATTGAIEKVVLNHDVEVNIIGDAKASGLCGTGLIDAVSALLRSGVMDETGRILDPDELSADVPNAIRERVVPTDGQNDFVLVHRDETENGEPLVLYQKDIRELQLANGAIRAGISILIQMEGLTPDDLHEVLLAGAFGNFIRRSSALRIGMLPAVPAERIRFVGNTASFGAKRALLSSDEAERAEQILARVTHVDLSLRPDFQMEFGAAMLFPEE
ncbi:MAG: DUF4445 domain-containing protein [Kiritimatiellae bacterium]|nr:DUF4445 domain-containing protein [Kiritimatiellia bacterium]